MSGSELALGGWRRVRRIGAGAMSEVWQVEREGVQAVAKLVQPDQRRNPVFQALARIEAHALALVRHDAVIRRIDAGDGWLVLEGAEGRLGDTPPSDWPAARAALVRVWAALDACHAAGVVHRDVKADNVLWTARGWVLADFGAARVDGIADPAPALGSPEAMAPERIAGRPASPASDRFSLGVLAYGLVCGRAPYPGRWEALRRAHAAGAPAVTPRFGVPTDVADWIGALVDPDPDGRPTAPPPA